LGSILGSFQALDDLLKRRKPILSAKRLLANQTFRDIYRIEMLAIGQRLKILSPDSDSVISRTPQSSASGSVTSSPGALRSKHPLWLLMEASGWRTIRQMLFNPDGRNVRRRE
jgi:hypothetical protein